MPTIPVYFDVLTLKKLERLADLEDLTVSKLVQLIVRGYFITAEEAARSHGPTTVPPGQ